MPEPSTVRFTYEDYLTIPDDSSRRHEIVDGQLFVIPAPRSRHQQVVMNLAHALVTRVREHDLGEVFPGPITVRLHEEGVVEPDVVFVRGERLEIVDPEGGVHGPPDLVVEVLSPSNRDYDRGGKRKQYLAHGVPELWLVDPEERTVEVWRADADRPGVLRDTLVWKAGRQRFEIPLEAIFRG